MPTKNKKFRRVAVCLTSLKKEVCFRNSTYLAKKQAMSMEKLYRTFVPDAPLDKSSLTKINSEIVEIRTFVAPLYLSRPINEKTLRFNLKIESPENVYRTVRLFGSSAFLRTGKGGSPCVLYDYILDLNYYGFLCVKKSDIKQVMACNFHIASLSPEGDVYSGEFTEASLSPIEMCIVMLECGEKADNKYKQQPNVREVVVPVPYDQMAIFLSDLTPRNIDWGTPIQPVPTDVVRIVATNNAANSIQGNGPLGQFVGGDNTPALREEIGRFITRREAQVTEEEFVRYMTQGLDQIHSAQPVPNRNSSFLDPGTRIAGPDRDVMPAIQRGPLPELNIADNK